MTDDEWDVYVVDEVREWIDSLDPDSYARVVQAIDLLAAVGPGLGRPLMDSIRGSSVAWYKTAIPLAEQRYEAYLKERTDEGGAL